MGDLARTFSGEPVSVVGVHTPKFPAESEAIRIRDAMERLGVDHPVVVDEGRRIWQSYGVRAWPTVVFIRPDGTVAATLPGEPDPENLREITSHLLDEGLRLGTLGGPGRLELELELEAEREPADGLLCFPAKAVPTPDGLAIADSGNHRILFADATGRVTSSVGDGTAGFEDGPPGSARFRRPQGLSLSGSHLFVADPGNHALRSIELTTGRVETIAGNGKLGRLQPAELVPATKVSLRSPWDVAWIDGMLFVAMAGFHQVWVYLPGEGLIGVFAGTGRETLQDGALHEASFAQPTGLARDGGRLHVADSESSSVREIDLYRETVRTLVGSGLFDFGDADGPPDAARLQHVRGLAHGPHGLLVTDTYNNKIKRVDEATRDVKTWFHGDGDAMMNEPTGITQLEGGQVLVADTNNHRIVVIDGDKRAKTLPIRRGDET